MWKNKPKKIEALRKHFDVVLHIPYCYTWDFLNIDIDKVEHELFCASLFKELKKRGHNVVRNKVFCLEEGECSLPSGRKGYPEEVIKIAFSLTEKPR